MRSVAFTCFKILSIAALVGAVLWLLFGVPYQAESRGYERGQIEALQGRQHYHLTTKPDGSSAYERKD